MSSCRAANAKPWAGDVYDVTRTTVGGHWLIATGTRYDVGALDRMYEVHRAGPVDAEPHVYIATPAYTPPVLAYYPSRRRVQEDLRDHGIRSSALLTPGDSLVTRARARIVGAFLRSSATHLLWWDADIEALDPTCVRAMLATGHDVIGGACPFRREGGAVVGNLSPEQLASARWEVRDGAIEAQDVGTGFQLVSRRALYRLMAAHPELRYTSRGQDDLGHPLWALYDCAIVDDNYLSEDYMFCRRWQELGGKVYIHVPSTYRHWGTHGYGGSFVEQYGLTET